MATDRLDGLSPFDLARIARIAGTAAFRKGVLTTRQQHAIDRIIDAARTRAASKEK
jgi:hypothetical protein